MFSNPLTATLLGAAFGGLLVSGGDEKGRDVLENARKQEKLEKSSE